MKKVKKFFRKVRWDLKDSYLQENMKTILEGKRIQNILKANKQNANYGKGLQNIETCWLTSTTTQMIKNSNQSIDRKMASSILRIKDNDTIL